MMRMLGSIDGFVIDRVFNELTSAYQLLTEPSDLIIIDLDCAPADRVFDFLDQLHRTGTTRFIACRMDADKQRIRRAFQAGSIGYIVKESTYEEFRANLILALNGGMPLSSCIARGLVESAHDEVSKKSVRIFSVSITEACRLIDEVLAEPLKRRRENLSDFLSREIGISYHHLSVQFKREMGVTLSYYVIMQKIERVKTMIRSNDHSLTQIANMMDYSSVAHLSTQFRKITGITPTEFKSNIR